MSRLKRKRLSADDAPAEQFRALRQIPSLSHQDCREVVSLLNNPDADSRTTTRSAQLYPDAWECLRDIPVKMVQGTTLCVPYMSLPDMVRAKMRKCPLFAAAFKELVGDQGIHLRMILHVDDAQGGNVLAPLAARKGTLVYGTFVGLPFVHLEHFWLTLSVIKATDVANCPGGLCSIVSAIIERIRADTTAGFPVDLLEQPTLIFVSKLLLLSDHEGLRAACGCKGAAGIKPCIKCSNVLASHRTERPGFVRIDCKDPQLFRAMTQSKIEEAATILERQPNKSQLEETEKLVGFTWANLQHSPLLKESLRGFFDADCLLFDSMHEYFSNGMVCQELGLWYSAFVTTSNGNLEKIRRYVALGWSHNKGGQPEHGGRLTTWFSDKLWKLHKDFRGDASQCLGVLPLAVAFGEEVLRDSCPGMRKALDSLKSLQAVVHCLQKAKKNPRTCASLLPLQQQHMTHFQEAYGREETRPKMHFSLHLTEQIRAHGHFIDCFTGERKHRNFKFLCGRNVNSGRCNDFAKVILLELAQKNLADQRPAGLLGTLLEGCSAEQPQYSQAVGLSADTAIFPKIKHRGIAYGKGLFCVLSTKIAIEVIGCLAHGSNHYLLVSVLTPCERTGPSNVPGFSHWVRPIAVEGNTALIKIDNDLNWTATQVLHVRKRGENKVSLLY
eukprot:Skav224275  [mRNA]  locus=scaffold217:56269:58275:+ [translate_table: standard]